MEKKELIYISVVKPVVYLDYDNEVPYDVFLDKYNNGGIEYLSKFQDGFYIVKRCFGVSRGVEPYYLLCFRKEINGFSIKSGNSFSTFLNFDKFVGEFDYVAAEQMLKEFEAGKQGFNQDCYHEYYDYYCEIIELLKEAVQIKGAVMIELE